MLENRQFPRLKTVLKIEYEFVKWNEHRLESLSNPHATECFDISARGLGIKNMPELRTNMLKKLKTGKQKMKIGIHLNNSDPPVIIFARFVWCNYNPKENDKNADIKCGLNIIDISQSILEILETYVNTNLKKQNKEKK